jgi:phosphoglycolate phosphatase-like HAD superfamily hydrolase
MRLVLFDIDGTLLLTDGAGRRAIHQALLAEVGTAGPIDGHRFDGKTDPQIIHELLALAGHGDAGDAARIAAVCARYLELLEVELARQHQLTRLLRGVPELLTALVPPEMQGRVMVGLLTGNLERGAALKLRAAGVAPERFAVGAYGSDAAHRPDLPAIARQRAETLAGHAISGSDVVIVGDTPEDVTCGRGIGARTVGVATGRYDVAALAAAGATHVFPSLADTVAVLDALLA